MIVSKALLNLFRIGISAWAALSRASLNFSGVDRLTDIATRKIRAMGNFRLRLSKISAASVSSL